MARVTGDGGHVQVERSALEQFGALRRSVRYPQGSVTALRRLGCGSGRHRSCPLPRATVERGVGGGRLPQAATPRLLVQKASTTSCGTSSVPLLSAFGGLERYETRWATISYRSRFWPPGSVHWE